MHLQHSREDLILTVDFFHSFFIHNNIYGRSIPPIIICDFWDGHLCSFMVHTWSLIWYPMYLCAWGHKSHWYLIPWVFVRWFCHCYLILLHYFCYHGVVFPVMKYSTQACHFYWGDSTKNSNESSGITDPTFWMDLWFDCHGIFFILHWQVSYKKWLWFPLWLVSSGVLVGTWTTSDTKNSQTEGL